MRSAVYPSNCGQSECSSIQQSPEHVVSGSVIIYKVPTDQMFVARHRGRQIDSVPRGYAAGKLCDAVRGTGLESKLAVKALVMFGKVA